MPSARASGASGRSARCEAHWAVPAHPCCTRCYQLRTKRVRVARGDTNSERRVAATPDVAPGATRAGWNGTPFGDGCISCNLRWIGLELRSPAELRARTDVADRRVVVHDVVDRPGRAPLHGQHR